MQYPIENKSFLKLLRELDKEMVIDIDKWSLFITVRNTLAHEYLDNGQERAEAISFLIENINELIATVNRIRQKYEA